MVQDLKPVQSAAQVASKQADRSTSTQPSASSDSTADAVSSLRALALSTLRSKRRRDPVGAQSALSKLFPTRPAAVNPNTVMLDYGSEEAQKVQDASDTPSLADKDAPAYKSISQSAGDGDVEVREEGEISDEDAQASPGPPSETPVNGMVNGMKFTSELISQNPISSQSTSPTTAMLTVADQTTPRPRLKEQPANHPPTVAHVRDLWHNWVPDQDHVRPGLKMNMDQFNMVKEVILDLLGWGVPPEYFIDCGVTREAVFYTFTELNLRLPKNLDIAGLVPSPPHLDIATANSVQSQSQSKASNDMPPPSIVPHRAEASPARARPPSLSHPLPAKPAVHAGGMPTSPTASATPSQLNNTNGQNLSDMEAQRKQELQARKAVLASLKKKAGSAAMAEQGTSRTSLASSPSVAAARAVTDVSTVPTETVDDFLQSMLEDTAPPVTPVASPPRPRALSGGVALGIPPAPPNGMDVDSEGIPGFGSYQTPPQHTPQRSVSKSSSSRDIALATPTSEGREACIILSPSGSAGPRRDSTPRGFDKPSVQSTSAAALLPEASLPIGRSTALNGSDSFVLVTNGKRGTKRPVAMDFVDMEQNMSGPSRSATHSAAPPPFVRRKMNSFAGLDKHVSRRCVIDVSDSEEEPGGEEGSNVGMDKEDGFNWASASSLNAPRVDSSTPVPLSEPLRPPSVIKNIPETTLTPATLMEKEEQIKRMKELIAQRELRRLRKLAEKTCTPVGTPPPSSDTVPPVSTSTPTRGEFPPSLTASSAMVKLEETESLPLSASVVSDGNSEVPRTWSTSESSADEDIVMQNLTEMDTPGSAFPTTTDIIKKNTLETSSTGEPVLTIEAKEQVRFSMTSRDQDTPREDNLAMPVNVDLSTSSAQTFDSQHEGLLMFSAYSSPFNSYPLLRSRSRIVADLASEDHSPSSVSFSSSSSTLPCRNSATSVAQKVLLPDLRPLRVAVMLREVGNDSGRRFCQYEVPGGGVCRDKTCPDIHVGDLEPDDHETARYLIETMSDVLQVYNESEIADQLLQARQKKVALVKSAIQGSGSPTALCSLEEIVAESIAALVGLDRWR